MKTYCILIFLFCTVSAMAQSLRDSLFSGKLKNPLKQTEISKDTAKKAIMGNDTVSSVLVEKKAETVVQKQDDTMPDSLNKLYYAKQKAWKRFIDQQTMIISQLADENRKVKKGEYYIEFEYGIGINGRVKTSNITCSPKNEFLIETVTDIMSRPPVLAPPVYGDGKPRAISARQQITILKK